ncbi:MAG TPA: DNA integrity scanning protein DisA nucleotide-binding domain protein [Candidatus Izemoplasmatales bacterium]|nr:DNA integrity scanning protein DisA nucleotide-binding domain protein [Candidatus Izemoplasmatales bacterium]
MNEFFITVMIAYLYSIFLLNLRSKLEAKQIRFLKILLLILTVFSVVTFMESLPYVDGLMLYTEIIALVVLPVFLATTYINEIKTVYGKLFVRKSKRSSTLINNDLALALSESVDYLAKRKIGALITVERGISLTDIVDNALMLNADVSKELLTSIFIPSTPLHDGAVIIRKNKIICAKAYFPASERTDLPMNYGTRHRAAIGISEQSDAFTIVVSEETGRVSITIDAEMEYNVTREALNLYLENVLKLD